MRVLGREATDKANNARGRDVSEAWFLLLKINRTLFFLVNSKERVKYPDP